MTCVMMTSLRLELRRKAPTNLHDNRENLVRYNVFPLPLYTEVFTCVIQNSRLLVFNEREVGVAIS